MESYFAVSSNFSANQQQLILDQDDTNHIVRVLRHVIGDEIVVVFQTKKYLAKIVSLTPNVVCQVIKALDYNNELPIKITLVMALLKEQKFDMVIQKAVELGVYQIVPIQMKRSISVVSENKAKAESKVARWQKIAKAAAKQSNRDIIPNIMPIVTKIADLKTYQSEINFLAYENAEVKNWDQNLKQAKSLTIIVGPEGGISDDELQAVHQLNFTDISLGKTILRAETAPFYFLSVVNYFSVLK